MAGTTLEKLLEHIRDGEATAEQIAEARELAAHDARLPEEIRSEVLIDADELVAVAVGLLAVLGSDDFGDLLKEALFDELDIADDVMAAISAVTPPVADAVRDEAGDIGIDRGLGSASVLFTAETLEELGDLGLPIRDAVLAEAGHVDIAAAVMSKLDIDSTGLADAIRAEAGDIDITAETLAALGDLGLSVREAVVAEAGAIDIASSVFATIGGESLDFAAAVRTEAGTIDIAARVVTDIGGSVSDIREAVLAEAGEAPNVWMGVIEIIGARQTIVPEAPVIAFPGEFTVSPAASGAHELPPPVPANNNSRWAYGIGALLMAAIALIIVGLTQVIPSSTIGDNASIATNDGDRAPNLEHVIPDRDGGSWTPEAVLVPTDMVFASAADVVVENLESGDDVVVMQMMGDDGAMILWVDEGEVL